MTAKLFTFCMLLLACVTSLSQDAISEFKDYPAHQVNLTSCPFDPEAEAIVLFDVTQAEHDDEYQLIQTRHVRIKVLSDKAVDEGNITIPYYHKNGFEFVKNVQGAVMTIETDGSRIIKEIRRSDIFDTKVNENYSEVKFALPNVKAGSILEYKFTRVSKSYNGLRDWHFQREIPTLFSSISVVILPGAEFSYVVHKKVDLPIKIDHNKNTGTAYFTMTNIAGLRDEPFMDAAKDYLQRVEFQLSSYTSFGNKVNYISKWADITKQLMSESYFGKAITKKVSDAQPVVDEANKLLTPSEKMLFLHNFIRKNFAWTKYHSYVATDGLKKVWENKKGTNGEINLLLINLLKQAGVEAYPALVSERNHGSVNPATPILDQFSTVVAYVVIDAKKYVLDATDEFTPANLVPFKYLNTSAFLINDNKGQIITLNDQEKSHLNIVNFNADIDKDGIVHGETTIISSDYAKVERSKTARQGSDKFIKEYISRSKEMKVDSLKIKENDTAGLEQHFHFATPTAETGNFHLLDINLFTGLEKNPFNNTNRFTQINYGSRYQTVVNQQYTLAEGSKADDLPKDVQLKMFDNSLEFSRSIKYVNNLLKVQIIFKINTPVISVGNYAQLKEFYAAMLKLLNDHVIIKSS